MEYRLPPGYPPEVVPRDSTCPIQKDTPTLDNPPVALEECLSRFSTALNQLFKTRKGKTNLLPHQQRALRILQQQQTFLIVPCDMNLGPAIIERHDYLKIAIRDYLSNTTTYKSLTTSEIDRYLSDIKNISLIGLKHTKNLKNGTRFYS